MEPPGRDQLRRKPSGAKSSMVRFCREAEEQKKNYDFKKKKVLVKMWIYSEPLCEVIV